VVQSYLRPQIKVSENDVKAKTQRLASGMGETEYLVSEIFLPVSNPDNEEEIRELGSKLIAEIQAGRAPFELVAAQFSKSASAQTGGSMGWVSKGELPKELDLVIASLEPGQISPPVRGLSGYHILSVKEQRTKTQENMPGEEDILNSIGLERLDRLQKRYLSDLQAAAFIERRL
jgi:peptidyl-prolyl cis-trans isomerase SurA